MKEMTYNKTMKPTIKPQPHKKATLTKKNNHHKTIKTNQTTKETINNKTKTNPNEQKIIIKQHQQLQIHH